MSIPHFLTVIFWQWQNPPIAAKFTNEIAPNSPMEIGGEVLIAKGRKALQTLAAKIDRTKMLLPSFMMVLGAEGDFA